MTPHWWCMINLSGQISSDQTMLNLTELTVIISPVTNVHNCVLKYGDRYWNKCIYLVCPSTIKVWDLQAALDPRAPASSLCLRTLVVRWSHYVVMKYESWLPELIVNTWKLFCHTYIATFMFLLDSIIMVHTFFDYVPGVLNSINASFL